MECPPGSSPDTPGQSDPEKSVGFASSESESHHHSHQHGEYRARAKERLHHFLHPDGRRIHVANSPEHALQLKQQLSDTPPEEPFDVHISGSPEHLEALREAHSHHEERSEALRERHGAIYDQFESVRSELDSLANELNRVTTHGVSLDAHFSRFGYNAHIKSYDDEDTPSQSGTTTPRGSIGDDKSIACSGDQGYAKPLKLFKAPVVRQYFHKGILWRASSAEEVQSFELFIDLLYVGIIAVNGDLTSENPNGISLLRFVITFTLSWKIWNDMALIISWFETDDIFQRVSILFLLTCLFGYTTNITDAFETTYATMIGFYLAARLYMMAYLLLVAYLVPMVRNIMLLYSASILVAVAVWIGSIHTDWPNQLAPIWIALSIDLLGPLLNLGVRMCFGIVGKKGIQKFDQIFEFWPAINIEHRTERTGAFVTLVFGYTVVAVLYQSAKNGIDAFFGKGVLGLLQAFFFNWLYFEIDGSNLVSHAIRRHKISAIAWSMAHLPFIMSFVLGGGALARLVLTHDTAGTNLEDLTENYQSRSEEEIPIGIRWFYCAGFGIALIFMGIIAISHVHKENKGLRLRKRFRLGMRFAVGIILICLPLAHHLNSLELIGTVTGLVSFVLVTELWATSCCGEKLCERTKPCKYTGKCGKKDLRALANGERDFSAASLLLEGKSKEGGLIFSPMT